MKTSSAKAKGRRAAAEVRELILKTFPDLGESDIMVTPSGVPGVDLWMSEIAQVHFPFSVEIKNQEAISIWACIKQAESNSSPHRPGILFFRRNRSELYVTIRADHFMEAIK